MKNKPKLPELLKQKRLELGESQFLFGKRFDRSHAAVSDWESGKTDIPNVVIEWVLFSKPSSECSQNGNKLPEKIEARVLRYGAINFDGDILESPNKEDFMVLINEFTDKINAIISYIESKEHGE